MYFLNTIKRRNFLRREGKKCKNSYLAFSIIYESKYITDRITVTFQSVNNDEKIVKDFMGKKVIYMQDLRGKIVLCFSVATH